MKRNCLPLTTVSLLISAFLGGCASYQNHYGVFSAANSAGEARQFRVTWTTADYPDWWLASDQATPIRLETQCSTRTWVLKDASHRTPHADACGEGIVACGDPEQDLEAASGEPAGAGVQCMRIANADRVLELDRQVRLLVACKPNDTEVLVGGEAVNRDYLRTSVVPYSISVRRAPRDSLSSRPPEFDNGICAKD
ncbi:hypothetical protein RE428_21610 [Marinobacter nanhaiticus D15-8W]|uniref:Uncharacterized protein n=1 Tax=Marinobacter nanhaiticus D15-8W TaxID=626887 RepID=N6VUG9_9GAMM|nr:hypothetical protein [Marinobacter nanhaiticus]ENO13770.1 hypothetical protein J057_20280 [Marinobacter nanhaiticus D15-8W]BES71143.1 hypothetical protein RE428_21610 [Marinobacter nanhaiticus D15-8W]